MDRLWLRPVLLALVVTFIPLLTSAQIIEDITFQRLEFHFDEQDPIPLSHWARALVVYAPGPQAQVLNVAARLPTGEAMWIIRNVPLAPDTIGQPQETLGIRFPLALMGVDVNDPLPEFDVDYSVTPTVLSDDEADAWLTGLGFPIPITLGADVIDATGDVWTGDVPDANQIPLLPFYPTYPSGSDDPVVHRYIGCEMPNVDLNRSTNTGDRNGCAPAAHANSMRWLDNGSTSIFFPRVLRLTYEDISKLMYRVPGEGTYWPEMLEGTLDFIEAYELPVQVEYQYSYGTYDIYSITDYTRAESQHSGSYPYWPTWDWLRDESVAGADVTFGVGKYYYDASLDIWRRAGGHIVVLTGTYSVGTVDHVVFKHDTSQRYAGGTVQEIGFITYASNGAMIVNGLGGTTRDPDDNEVTYVAWVEKVMSKGYHSGAGDVPSTDDIVRDGARFIRTVPAGYAISVTWPYHFSRCFNVKLYRLYRDVADPHGIHIADWNWNSQQTKTWINNTGHAATFIMVGNDQGVAYDVSYTMAEDPGAVGTPGNPWAFGGLSFGWNDGSPAEFGSPEGPVVAVMPLPGFSLAEFPAVMDPGGVSMLHIDYHIDEWHETWEELGLSLQIDEVYEPGPLFIDCPSTGYVGDLEINEPGLYEIDLGTVAVPEPQLFHLTLETSLSAAFSFDRVGIPSLVTPTTVPGGGDVPPAPELAAPYPNPFNAGTTMEFSLPRQSDVLLAVYDLRGRRVRTLVDGPAGAGDHTVTWLGRDDSGQNVPSGVYVCRLEVAGASMMRRVALVK